jgi:hypothetical protein
MSSKISLSIIAALGGLFVIPAPAQQWQATAKWHRTLKKPVQGTLLWDDAGVEFRSAKFNQRWPYQEIRGFDLFDRDLTMLSYQRRPWHEPGERPFHFTLGEAMPPEIAAQFTERVGRPVRNGDPVPAATAIAELPAHRRTWSGGSNGTLRFKDDGIDYIAKNGRDSRSWRWADIETLANPNPYELRVGAYREIVEFDLKRPIERSLFERMWDRLYSPGLNLSARTS